MPWFAVNEDTGIPEDSKLLYERYKWDLSRARGYILYTYFAAKGDVVKRWHGEVEVEYTCEKPIGSQGYGCVWRVRYSTNRGKTIWMHRTYDRTSRSFSGSDRVQVCPL